jgi:hypothetical protein
MALRAAHGPTVAVRGSGFNTFRDSRHRTRTMLVDDFLPVYDVSDAVATVVAADVATTWNALMEVDLIDVGRRRPLVAALGALRVLPDVVAHLLHGELPHRPSHLRLRETTHIAPDRGGWMLLGERPQDEIALGLVGKFWQPVIAYATVSTTDEFRAFTEPGFAKTVYSLSVRPLAGGHTLVSGVMRTATTDEQARRRFRQYWTFGVGSGAHVLVNGVLDVIREMAEGHDGEGSPRLDSTDTAQHPSDTGGVSKGRFHLLGGHVPCA